MPFVKSFKINILVCTYYEIIEIMYRSPKHKQDFNYRKDDEPVLIVF